MPRPPPNAPEPELPEARMWRVMTRRCLSLFAALTISVGSLASADTEPSISPAVIRTVKCVYDLLKSSPAVQSVDVYVVDKSRSAVEYRFKGKHGNVVTSDLMLTTTFVPDVIWEIIEPQGKSRDDLPESDPFSAEKMDSICHVSPGFDDTIPGPKPRAEWQQVDPSTLLPSPVPSPG